MARSSLNFGHGHALELEGPDGKPILKIVRSFDEETRGLRWWSTSSTNIARKSSKYAFVILDQTT